MTALNLFGSVPLGALQQPTPFTLGVPQAELQRFEALLELSPIAELTWENLQQDWGFGVPRDWMENTTEYWINTYNW